MLVKLDTEVKKRLADRGVESLHAPHARISDKVILEPPCSIKWMQIENNFALGAFSYAVSGYFSETTIGRYTSIGEQVQIGRSSHALTWVTTSPFLYLRQKIFQVGEQFPDADKYHAYLPPIRHGAKTTEFRRITIGNDVYIGHGAFIMPGVTIGDGAIVGAMSVVTSNVPAYGVVAGNPARLIKLRHSPKVIAGLLETEWWRFAPWQLTEIDFSSPDSAIDDLKLLVERESPYNPKTFTISDVVAERDEMPDRANS